MKKILSLSFIFLTIVTHGQQGLKYTALDLDSIFRENNGTFVLFNLNKDSYQIYNIYRAKTEYSVHSTSKIFWTIIGLEEGLVNDNETISWDSIKYPRTEYWPKEFSYDQTVETALRYSVNWYYFELLKKMTPEMVEKYLIKLDYKSGFHVEKVHYFGLTYNIEKSALDQIDFLKRLYLNEFNLSDKTTRIIKSGLNVKETDSYKLYVRTGMGPIKNDTGIAWYTGFIERDDNTFFFAANVENDDELVCKKLCTDFSLRTLKTLRIIE